ncbi:unnamed protein product [Durusdinium trenchii]|uniref:Rab-GAP TBC domain-containing protein n=2 Tax=Durusdinium trenchii TaxID=1381693 RepID=A0ABP0NY78_9DINO
MPAEPGRFTAMKDHSQHSREQQVNVQWQGPRLCEEYNALWQSLCNDSPVTFSEWVLRAVDTVPQTVTWELEAALDVKPTKVVGVGRKMHEKNRKAVYDETQRLKLPAIPSYSQQQGRVKLVLALKAFAAWRPRVGFNVVIAGLAGQLMAVLGNERHTFKLLALLYDRYHLKDYFEHDWTRRREKIMLDAQKVWDTTEYQWPDLFQIFQRFKGGKEIFMDIVRHLLSTLLTEAHTPEIQAFEWHVRLLHRLVLPVGTVVPNDPRGPLRHLIMIIMARHQHLFMTCRSEKELELKVGNLRRSVRMDPLLAKLLAKEPGREEVNLFPSLMIGSAAGIFSHHVLGLLPSFFEPTELVLSLSAAAAGAIASLRWQVRCHNEHVADANRALLAGERRKSHSCVVT